jgi:hypothetical protein
MYIRNKMALNSTINITGQCYNQLHYSELCAAARATTLQTMSFRGVGLFTSSPLSAPPSSPRKHPIASTSLIPMDEESEDDVDQEMANTGDDADESADTSHEDSAVAAEYEVEAIIARKGGYNGKTLMYLIRWVRVSST